METNVKLNNNSIKPWEFNPKNGVCFTFFESLDDEVRVAGTEWMFQLMSAFYNGALCFSQANFVEWGKPAIFLDACSPFGTEVVVICQHGLNGTEHDFFTFCTPPEVAEWAWQDDSTTVLPFDPRAAGHATFS